jgi:hypothetical protein
MGDHWPGTIPSRLVHHIVTLLGVSMAQLRDDMARPYLHEVGLLGVPVGAI